jgi:receptor protein-tyrosine kinase
MMFMRLPELGAVPSMKGRGALDASSKEIVPVGGKAEAENSLLKESFRSVLTSILLSTRLDRRTKGPRAQLLVVSSLDMMEGKTTIVTNLGMASAERRREVLLIDADLRRPRLHERFNLPNDGGLMNMLERNEPIDPLDNSFMESLVQPTQIPHLFVLTSGATDNSSPDRLYGANLEAVLKYFERRFDLVLVDTPPMLMYSDARILGRMAEGVVMVVRANKRSREELRSAYQKLVQDRIPVIGTVLNDWNIGSSQARAYNKYYSHYQNRG